MILVSVTALTVMSSAVTLALVTFATMLDNARLRTTETPTACANDAPTAIVAATAVACKSASSSARTLTSSVASITICPVMRASTSFWIRFSIPKPPPATATPPMATDAITASCPRTSARTTSAFTTTSSPAVMVSELSPVIAASDLPKNFACIMATPTEPPTKPPAKLAPMASAPSSKESWNARTRTSP